MSTNEPMLSVAVSLDKMATNTTDNVNMILQEKRNQVREGRVYGEGTDTKNIFYAGSRITNEQAPSRLRKGHHSRYKGVIGGRTGEEAQSAP